MHRTKQLIISVARYASGSPMWEVCVWWQATTAEEPTHDFCKVFGSEAAAWAFARKLQNVVDNRVNRAFK